MGVNNPEIEIRYDEGNNSVICYITLCILLITLQSFYFPVVGSVFTYIGYLGLAIYSWSLFPPFKRDIVVSMLCIALFCCSSIVTITQEISFLDLKSTLSIIILLLLYPSIFTLMIRKSRVFYAALKYVLLIHISMVFIQLTYFIFTLEYLDILQLLHGEKSGSIGKKSLMFNGIRVPRFSGLLNEPGSYSVLVIALTSAYYSIGKQVDKIVIISIISVLITMSGFGFFLSILLIIAFAMTNNKNLIRIFRLTPFIIIALWYVGVIEQVLARFDLNSEYSELGLRSEMIYYYFSNTNVMLFGVPIGKLPNHFVPNDVGVWYELFIKTGAFGWLIILVIYANNYINVKKVSFLILLSAIFLTKLKLTYPMFWLVIMMLSFYDYKKIKPN